MAIGEMDGGAVPQWKWLVEDRPLSREGVFSCRSFVGGCVRSHPAIDRSHWSLASRTLFIDLIRKAKGHPSFLAGVG
jgi:hypothetical protein